MVFYTLAPRIRLPTFEHTFKHFFFEHFLDPTPTFSHSLFILSLTHHLIFTWHSPAILRSQATGKEQRIAIRSSGGLNEKEIEAMVRDAEANQEADLKRKEAAEAKNELDGLIHSVDKNLSEHADKLDDKTKEEVKAALEDARKVDKEVEKAIISI